mmetsp:Transcript_4209/g.7505  ORF Transcript_4209/g.7505 Transcript_4209/m.7505 type:complete len:158 (-) Transcript_4209:87-560(-)
MSIFRPSVFKENYVLLSSVFVKKETGVSFHQIRQFKINTLKNNRTSKSSRRAEEANLEGNPRLQQIVSFILPDERQPKPLTSEQSSYQGILLEAKRASEIDHEKEWHSKMMTKHALQFRAINTLPSRLRAHALQPDYSPIPLNRKLLFFTPPESYRD